MVKGAGNGNPSSGTVLRRTGASLGSGNHGKLSRPSKTQARLALPKGDDITDAGGADQSSLDAGALREVL